MPKLNEAQQAQRRAHLLDAAEVCFARSGFHRTTMQEICREAGVSAGAFYVYFRSKEALIDGIVERDREEIMVALGRAHQAPDLLAGLEGLLRACVLERPSHKAALYLDMLAEANRNPQIASAVRSCENTLVQALTAMLAHEQQSGRLAQDVDPAWATRLLLVLGDGIFVLRARNTPDDVERVVHDAMAMVARFLFPAQTDEPAQVVAPAHRRAGLPTPVEPVIAAGVAE